MRLFVALWPSAEVREQLRRRLAGSGRLTSTERWHVTLCFLGDVPDDRLIEVERALDGLPAHPPITLRLAGSRTFGRGVLAARVAGDLAELGALHRDVATALDAGTRPYEPHLTITYHRTLAVQQVLEGYRSPDWTADRFTLVQSSAGYHRLRSWPLSGEPMRRYD